MFSLTWGLGPPHETIRHASRPTTTQPLTVISQRPLSPGCTPGDGYPQKGLTTLGSHHPRQDPGKEEGPAGEARPSGVEVNLRRRVDTTVIDRSVVNT